jgi:hypothetical protein
LSEESSISKSFHFENANVLRRERRQDILDKALVTRVSGIDRHLAGIKLIGYYHDAPVSAGVRRACPAKGPF